MSDARTFVRDRYLPLFRRGVELLEQRAPQSDRARRILEDVKGARGSARLAFEGGGELWLSFDQGRMAAHDERPADLPVRLAVALPEEAALLWLESLAGAVDLDSDEAAVRTARSVSQRVEKAVGDTPIEAHLVVLETPDFDEVRIRIGVHTEAPPEEPRFTATVRWDDLEAARRAGGGLQQLMMSGKLRLVGDYSRAMQVGMQLMQQPL